MEANRVDLLGLDGASPQLARRKAEFAFIGGNDRVSPSPPARLSLETVDHGWLDAGPRRDVEEGAVGVHAGLAAHSAQATTHRRFVIVIRLTHERGRYANRRVAYSRNDKVGRDATGTWRNVATRTGWVAHVRVTRTKKDALCGLFGLGP